MIQSIVRGFLSRKKFYQLICQVQERRLLDRQAAKIEQAFMAREDKLSSDAENEFRNDKDLQKRIAEAKKARIKAETERKRKILLDAAIRIQKTVRGLLGKVKGRR